MMRISISRAAHEVRHGLAARMLDEAGSVDDDAVTGLTTTIQQALSARHGPRSAVYIAWDTRGRCRYVGSVRRPQSRSAVRARLKEHMTHADRRSTWYAVTVVPLCDDLTTDQVRHCEGLVARLLCPTDGTAHPVPKILANPFLSLAEPVSVQAATQESLSTG